jgi:hypothetical protein
VFLLVSGDDDLTEAVEEAQVHGVQVSLLAVPTVEGRPHGVSRHLLRAADALTTLDASTIQAAVMKVEPTKKLEVPTPANSVPTPTPTPAPIARPASPTPNDVVRRARPAQPVPSSSLAYSATTGGHAHVIPGFEATDIEEQIDVVVRNVFGAFRSSAGPEQWAELHGGRPSIPRDIDRALLTDLSETLAVYDLPDAVRFQLRDRFWQIADQRS